MVNRKGGNNFSFERPQTTTSTVQKVNEIIQMRESIERARTQQFLNTSLASNNNVSRNHQQVDEDRLNIRYVSDIESLMPPRFNPDTRTYFKCSIYSPSNRLYTVNEEVNSTQSDVGGAAGDQFSSSSLLNSGLRRSSNHRSQKFN